MVWCVIKGEDGVSAERERKESGGGNTVCCPGAEVQFVQSAVIAIRL